MLKVIILIKIFSAVTIIHICHLTGKNGLSPKRVIDFRSDWALCWGVRWAAFGVADASLSHRKHPLSGQHDVGHEGVITRCDGFSLRSSIANPQGVAQSERRSTYLHSRRFN